jgi:hypothetical protein
LVDAAEATKVVGDGGIFFKDAKEKNHNGVK